MMTGRLVAGRFATSGAENRTYKRDRDGKFSSGFGSKGSPRDLADHDDVIKRELAFHDSESGMSMAVHEISRKHGGPYVTLHVTDLAGAHVGEFAYRLVQRGEHGDAVFDVAHMKPEAQGQGFGTKASRHVEEVLRAYGNEKVTGYASMGGGGHAWARAGYDFEGENGSRFNVRERAKAKAKEYPKEVQSEIKAVAKIKDSTPMDFAMIGWRPGATTWPGKEIMRGSDWGMVKRLDA